MKKIVLLFAIFISCNNINHLKKEDDLVTLSVPIGERIITKYNFPEKWRNIQEFDDNNSLFSIENVSEKGYDTLSYFLSLNSYNLYNTLKIKSKAIKLPDYESNVLLNLYDNFVKLDSAYYIATLGKQSNYNINLYKNGYKYKELLGTNQEFSSFDYLVLVTESMKNIPIDYKIVYYTNFNDIISYHRFFYIDKDFTITIKDFIQDELYTQSFKNKTFKINQEGFFIREKNN